MNEPFAILREVADTINDCELTYFKREIIDLEKARRQHMEYKHLLEDNGFQVRVIPADSNFPDCVFIEDVALPLDPVVITNPTMASRRLELLGLEAELGREYIEMPSCAHLEGGDVLRIKDTLYVGLSTRTDESGLQWLSEHTNYKVVPVKTEGVLHLKTGLTALDDNKILVNSECNIDLSPFEEYEIHKTPSGEGHGACVLRLPNGKILMAEKFIETRKLVEALGFQVAVADLSEFEKAEGSPTCLSLRFNTVGS